MKTEVEIQSIRNSLAQFSGSDIFTKWSALFRNCVLTEGALHLAESCGAYWLMDLIASHQTSAKVRAESFQVWKLTPKGKGWQAIAEDGNNNVIAKQNLSYSDFPFIEGITLWAVKNEFGGVTIMLPSEY